MGASKGPRRDGSGDAPRRSASGGTGPRGRTAQTDQRETDQEAFLQAFSMVGSITKAAEALRAAQETRYASARIARDIHYRWLREDPTYKDRFEVARAEFGDVIEAEVVRRAIEGDEDFIVSAGKLVYIDNDPGQGPLLQRKRSDRMLEILAKAHIDRYGDRQKIEHSGEVRTIQSLLSDVPEEGE